MRRRIVIAALAAGAVLAGSAVAAAQPADQSVVVLLKDAKHSADVLRQPVKDLSLGNGFAAKVTAGQQQALAVNPDVAAVIPDVRVTLHSESVEQPHSGTPGKPSNSRDLCPADPAKPQLEPEALRSIHAQTDMTGKGVKVAYIADGIDPDNADFKRADGSKAIVDVKDFTGRPVDHPTDGQEAFGDASSIGAQGLVSHDISTFVNPAHPLPAGCTIRIKGVAPDADIVALDAFDSPNSTTISSVLQAIDYAVNVAHVDVLNESFGLYDFTTTSTRDAVELFNDQAVAHGVTVVTASGDGGATNTLNSPGADPKVINVGASTDYRLWAQIGADGYGLGKGGWLDDNISSLSSTGISQAGGTIDVTAPGEKNWAACTASALYQGCVDKSGKPASVLPFGGTSEAAPLTAAAAALVIQVYRQSHGSSPTPKQVKQIITGSAHDLGVPVQYEGAGLLDVHAAVELARGVSGILLSTNQISHDGQPGSSRDDQIDVSNPGGKPIVVHAATRHYVDRGPSQEHDIALDPKTASTFPSDTGATMAYASTTFTVDSGTDVVAVNAAWPGAGQDVPITLFDPQGRMALNSYPEGSASYANLIVRQPTPGTWTAVAATSAAFSGTVRVSVRQQSAAPIGKVLPADFVLLPGQHKSVTVTSTFPTTTGDSANAVTFTTPLGTTAVATILRSVVPLTGGKGSFGGTITGGNGRAFDPAESFTYAFDVPAGASGLNVVVVLSKPGDVLTGALIGPNGETPSIGTNHSSLDDPTKVEPALSLSVVDPLPGRWRYVLAAQNPVAGDLETPFTGKIALHSGLTVFSDLPNGATIPAGRPTIAQVTATNTSPQTVYVQTDARTPVAQDIKLAGRVGLGNPTGPTVRLPMQGFVSPSYLVPPQTSSVTITSTATVPAQVELASVGTIGPWGAVNAVGDLKSAQAGNTTSTATVSEQHGYVGHGDWLASLTEIGPFGPGGVPKAQGTLAVTAKTLGFDPTVTSPTGDPYTASTDAAYDGGKPLAIAPGASATIPVTITPNAAAGTVVTGTLNIVSPGDGTELGRVVLEPVPLSGDVFASIPYRYTVG